MTTKPTSRQTTFGERVKALRKERRWTQTQFAKLLGISQSYLSELEHGQGSFSAEQLLSILKTFNVPIEYFSPRKTPIENQIQNALARQGATHLAESSDLLPSQKLRQAADAIREALVSGESARQITSAAPIFVDHAGNLNFNKLRIEFAQLGLENRLAWALENTIEAIKLESAHVQPREWRLKYRRALIIIEQFFRPWQLLPKPAADARLPAAWDVLDPDITSEESLKEARENLSPISRRWGVTTRIKLDDFVEALRAARDTH